MVSSVEKQRKELALKLYQVSAFKFGKYTLKSGEISPVYFDLRVIISYPEIMEELTDLMYKFIVENEVQCDQLCGVPYTALPLATLLSVKMRQPMLIRRKEAKSYGTKKLIEGKFQPQETALIIEDVVTTGSSVLETTKDLRAEGLVIEDAIVVVDRQQGGEKSLSNNGIKMHSLFTLAYLIETLRDEGKIEEELAKTLNDYISKKPLGETKPSKSSRILMPFSKRADVAKNETAQILFNIMETKKTNLCVAADVTKTEEILNLAESLGPYICILKIHVDIIENFTQDFVKSLKTLADKHKFLLMEDRKFADIGNTVGLQFSSGIYKIADWADLITVHSLPGAGLLKAIKESANKNKSLGIFLLAEMSSEGNLITNEYSSKTLEMANEYAENITGIVAQSSELISDPGMIQLTPGCKLEESGDNLGQIYNTPENLIGVRGADVAVVGRGIFTSKNPVEVAKLYRSKLWDAYEQRINEHN